MTAVPSRPATGQLAPVDTIPPRAGGVELARGRVVSADTAGVRLAKLAGTDTLSAPRTAFDRAEMLSSGDTVRVFFGRGELAHGILDHVDSTTMVIENFSGTESTRYMRSQIDRAEVMRGRKRRGSSAVAKGAFIGGAVGAGLAGIFITVTNANQEGMGTLLVVAAGAFGAAIGTGAGIFAALGDVDRWVAVNTRTLALEPEGR